MKKKLFTILLCGGVLISLTGCDNEKNLTSISEDKQGYYLGSEAGIAGNSYKVYKLEANTLIATHCYNAKNKGVDKCDFSNSSDKYTIKDIKSKSDDDFYFNAYKDDEKKYECFTSFGKLNCTSSSGVADSASKK